MAAGTMMVRTTVASMKIATARPKPICWNITSSPPAMPANTHTMMAAAPVMMPAVRPTPKATASRVSPVWSKRSLMRLMRNTW